MLLLAAPSASAHILQYFLWLRVDRAIELTSSTVRIEYRCDLRPEALASPDPLLDLTGDGTADDEEKELFFHQAVSYMNIDLFAAHMKQPVPLTAAALELTPDRNGFRVAYSGALQPPQPTQVHDLLYVIDPAYIGANYMAESVTSPTRVLAGDGVELLRDGRESVGSLEVASGVNTVITFRRTGFEAGPAPATATQHAAQEPATTATATGTPDGAAPTVADGTNRLKDMVATGGKSPWLVFVSLMVAALLGGLHALQPGHGKTIVAAYLVGSRGRIRDAVWLGGIVTFTHTFSVIVLGVIALVASKHIVQEKLFGALGIMSGALIFALGAVLLSQRMRLLGVHAHGLHVHTHAHRHDSGGVDEQKHGQQHGHGHEHPHEEGHAHDHEHDARHAHGAADAHSHGGRAHTHEVPGKVSLRTLIALGVSGGMVPCPDAVVVLLIAVAMNRIGLGLAIIAAFSVGLAAVLIAIGILTVTARPLVERLSGGAESRLVRVYLPIGSAVLVMLLGLALMVQVLVQTGVVRVAAG